MSFINLYLKKKKFPPEIESGNIEYKRKLINKDNKRIEQLTTQLNWRLNEGFIKYDIYKASYIIGVEDNGNFSKLLEEDIDKSIKLLELISSKCNSKIINITKIFLNNSFIAQVDIKKNNKKYKELPEVKICFIGNTNSGKSTLFSVLTNSNKDDGNGLSRNKILKHLHEYTNGVTTSINYDLIGFKNDNLINYSNLIDYSWESIIKSTDKIVSLIDLPGNIKYIKTILFGLLVHNPDYICFVIDSNNFNRKKYKYYINIVKNLKIDYFFVITKIDISTSEEIENIKKYIDSTKEIFEISNVTHQNLHLTIKYISDLKSKNKISVNCDDKEFIINEVYNIPHMGLVICGIVLNGCIKVGEILNLGPVNNITIKIKIKTIHKKQIPCNSIYKNELGSMSIELLDNNKIKLNKRMIIVEDKLLSNFTKKFIIIISDDKNKYNINNFNLLLTIFMNNIKINISLHELKVENDNIKLTVKSKNICYIKNKSNVVIKNNSKLYFGKVYKIDFNF
jgi:GTPase